MRIRDLPTMLSILHLGAALVAFSQAAQAWNATVYSAANCTGKSYKIYNLEEHTKYFELEGSTGEGIACTFYNTDNSTAGCNDQFPVGKSVFSTVGSCGDFPQPHSIGTPADQGPGECLTPDFDILSVVCYDETD
ncbi:hypothetical protein F5Y16DRAFT_393641 [Xylariaceae sp. FL0255]|nr:hypothetical protein F5Y16DRAFT_393641 [Xylariaceae sp. FL0255]